MKKSILLLAAGLLATSAVAQEKVYLIKNNTIVATYDRANVDEIMFENNLPTPTITSVNPTTVLVGKKLTITGTNFSTDRAANKVTINDVACNVSAATATQLDVIVPTMEPGSYPVVVTVNEKTVTGPVVEVKNGETINVWEGIIDITKIGDGTGVHAIEFTADGKLLLLSSDDNKPNVIYSFDWDSEVATPLYTGTKTWYWFANRVGNKLLLPSKPQGKMEVMDLTTNTITTLATELPQILRVCTDANGNAYALLRDAAKVVKFNGMTGEGMTDVLDAKATDGQLWDMCFDNDGNLLVFGNCALYCIAPDGTKTTIVGATGQGSTDADLHDYMGNAGECKIQKGRVIFCDSKGYVWFQDQWNILRVLTKGATGYQDGNVKIVSRQDGSKLGELGQIAEDPTTSAHEVMAVSWNLKQVFAISIE